MDDEIKNNLRTLVARSGMKHKFLADKVGVSTVAFSSWINNHSHPKGFSTARLESLLDCNGTDIFPDARVED